MTRLTLVVLVFPIACDDPGEGPNVTATADSTSTPADSNGLRYETSETRECGMCMSDENGDIAWAKCRERFNDLCWEDEALNNLGWQGAAACAYEDEACATLPSVPDHARDARNNPTPGCGKCIPQWVETIVNDPENGTRWCGQNVDTGEICCAEDGSADPLNCPSGKRTRWAFCTYVFGDICFDDDAENISGHADPAVCVPHDSPTIEPSLGDRCMQQPAIPEGLTHSPRE